MSAHLEPNSLELPPRTTREEPKWAAVVADTLVPMPRRRLRARDILHLADAPAGASLVRDLNDPVDVGFLPDDVVDLGEGNIFRLGCGCPQSERGAEGAAPKLAFVLDDAWEVTTNPDQTAESLRALLGLDREYEILRDYESPRDEPIGEGDPVSFGDGPVFRARRRVVTVKVNNNPVTFAKRRVTGLEIKETAIAQGVAIQPDFVLYRVVDGALVPIGDREEVHLRECDEFRCVAPDDNS